MTLASGRSKRYFFAALFVFTFFLQQFSNAQITIAEARTKAVGETVTVRGVALNGYTLGTIRYLQDNTGGIAVYSATLSQVAEGDSIMVTGVLDDYYNLLEINPINSVEYYQGGIKRTPALITPSQMNESFESELVTIENVTFDPGQGTTFSGGTYDFHSGSQSGVIYIRTGSPIIGYTIPAGSVTLTGICSQFSSTYQLIPRSRDDIASGNINITSAVIMDNLTTNGFRLQWKTDVTGSTEAYYGKTSALELGRILSPGGNTSHTLPFSGLQPSDVIYVKVYSVSNHDTAFGPVQAYCTQSLSPGWMRVYFTQATDHSVATGAEAVTLGTILEDTVIAYINRAKLSIDMTMYNFNLTRVPSALNQAVARGVRVRLIYNANTTNSSLSLIPGIPKLKSPEGYDYNIMHNKFLIFDAEGDPENAIVWTGSTNFTTTQLNVDANNVIIINDKSLARSYTLEFEEMWGGSGNTPNAAASKFGQFKTDNTPHQFIIGGKKVESWFSPSDGVNGKILETISSAGSTIDVATMLITRDDIGQALREKHDAGIMTQIIVDGKSDCSDNVVNFLNPLGNRFVEDSHTSGLEHNKYLLADRNATSSDPTVLTGSHNWSNSANTVNDENTLVIHDAAIANLYYQEFVARFKANGGVLSIFDEKEPSKENFLIYPNPFSNHINLKKLNKAIQVKQINIFDMFGRLVYSTEIQDNEDTELNPELQTSGMYFLEIITDKGKYIVKIYKI